MIHIDICPSCEETGDDKPKLLCDNCGFCIETHHEDYCGIANILRAYLKQDGRVEVPDHFEGRTRGGDVL